MFDKVVENLKRYNQYGNVVLKYLIAPGVNDNRADYEEFVESVKK